MIDYRLIRWVTNRFAIDNLGSTAYQQQIHEIFTIPIRYVNCYAIQIVVVGIVNR